MKLDDLGGCEHLFLSFLQSLCNLDKNLKLCWRDKPNAQFLRAKDGHISEPKPSFASFP